MKYLKAIFFFPFHVIMMIGIIYRIIRINRNKELNELLFKNEIDEQESKDILSDLDFGRADDSN